ncbi:MAG: M16 family metallopeptidase [Chthoniobacterales bacterium]
MALASLSLTSAHTANTANTAHTASKTAKPSSTKATASASITLPASTAQVTTLDNGLTVIIDEDSSAPVASVQMWCKTGSIHEDKWLGAGLSHILEHMLFKGTEKRGAGDIAREVQDAGGYINAYTSFDRTVYWIDVPSSGVSTAIDVLSDAMMNSTLPEDEYLKEQEVIRREFAMGFDDPNRQSMHLLLRTMYSESPLRMPVIGELDIYNRLTRDDVMEYYKKRYVPNNLTLVVVGDVDAKAVLEQIKGLFADYPRCALKPVYLPEEPEQLGRRDAHEEFATELTRLNLAWKVPGLADADAPALEVLADILGSGASSILNQDLREKKGLVHGIGAGVYSMPDTGAFFISAVTDPDKREKSAAEILNVIQQIEKEGVTDDQVAKARRSLLSEQLYSLTTARGKASGYGSDWFLTHNLDFGHQFLKNLDAVTPQDVKRVANKYLRNDKLTFTSLNPTGTLAQEKANKDIQKRSKIEKFELSNGLRLLVCEDHRLPLVSLFATFRGGLLAETPENNGITKLLSASILKGTKTRSAKELVTELESLGGSFSVNSGNNSFSVGVNLLSADLSTGMELLADVLENPAFPAKEVALEKAAQEASIKSEEDQITAVGRNVLREKLFKDHPYALRASGSLESLKNLDEKSLRAFYEKLVVGSNGVLAVVGDVKAADVKSLAEKYLTKLPAGTLANTNAPQPPILDKSIAAIEERDKQQALVMVGYRGLKVTDADRPVLELIDQACSDLGSRFFNRIREKMGLAYYVGSSQMSGLVPGLFVFYAGTDPAKVDQVVVALNEEIQGLAQDGLTEAELNRAKKKLLGAESIRNQSNSAFAEENAISELVGLGYDLKDRRIEEVEAVTLEDTKRVAQKYFLNQKPVEVVVRPPKKNGVVTEK